MPWLDDDNNRYQYEISKIVKQIYPNPVGMRTVYEPGEGGFMQKTSLREVPSPINLNTSEGPQRRLEQLEASSMGSPQPLTSNLTTGSLPTANIGALPTTSGATAPPEYRLQEDMRTYFDEAVKTLTSPSKEAEYLKSIAQGFGLIGMKPKEASMARIAAMKALEDIEQTKQNTISNLAKTLSALMVEPSKFNLDVWKTQVAQEMEKRRQGLAEMKAQWEIQKMMREAPAIATGLTEAGEKATYTWEPESQQWKLLTKGALPIAVGEGQTLYEPGTGRVIHEGETGRRFKEKMGEITYKSFLDELKDIEQNPAYQVNEQMKEEERKRREQLKNIALSQAYQRFNETMNRLGYGALLGTMGPPSGGVPKEGTIVKGVYGTYIFKNGRYQPLE